ncbi:MAG: NUDIX hydrolase [Candidatus Uhrbacteria bacterium]
MNRQNGPWTIKESKEVYKNPWMRVREDQVVRPDGKDGIHAVVEIIPGVSVLPIDDQGNVYLTEEFHYAVEDQSTEVISGGIDADEQPLDAAKRELKEETGIEAKEWIDLGLVNPFTTVVKSPAHLYLAKGLSFSEAEPEGTEQIKVLHVNLEEAVQMVLDSKITHGPSVALILKAKQYLNQ